MDYDLIKQLYVEEQDSTQQDSTAPPIIEEPLPLTIRDEGISQSSTVDDIDFIGLGVTATRQEDGRMIVNIDQAPPGVSSNVHDISKLNSSGITIEKDSAVSERIDGSIAKCDADNANDEDFYGIALESIIPGATGAIRTGGEVPNALAGLGFAAEKTAYVSATPGILSSSGHNISGRLVYKAGIASGASGENLIIEKKKIIRNP